jgi:hypothetical protein
MFAGQLAGLMPSGPSALPLPPVPEEVPSLDWLRRLAEARDDDLLDGGSIDPNSPHQMMLMMTELAADYAGLWSSHAERLTTEPIPAPESTTTALPDVDDLLLSVMSDAERISRLARLAGTIRYAVDVADHRLVDETAAEMDRIGRHLPDSYRLGELLDAARRPGPTGSRLLQLHIERCYKLAAEEYGELDGLDREIARLAARD